MSISEFRYNKKRKHYSYIFKTKGTYRKNIVFSTKSVRIWKGKIKNNVRLFKHPNPNSNKTLYVIPVVYADNATCFYPKKLEWFFDRNDKRLIKRIKRKKRK